MCGRFTLRLTPSELQQVFDLFREPDVVPRYNIAPTQSVSVIRRTDDGNELSMMRWGQSCTILTTDANSLLRELHDRMPVILDNSDHEAWLDPEIPSEDLTSLLTSYPSERMQAVAVSTVVNNARNEKPECVVPVE